MTSSRRPTTYKPRRSRREVGVAVLAVLAVLVVTGALLWLLKPADDESTPTPPISIPTTPSTAPGTTVPGDTSVPASTVPASTPDTAPAGG